MGSVTAGHGHAARTHHAVLSPRGTLHYRERLQLRRLCQRGRTIADLERRRYLVRHLAALHNVLAKGIPVRGCFAWSLIDNFECAEGYTHRLGLAHVDFERQQRKLKLSSAWHRDFLRLADDAR